MREWFSPASWPALRLRRGSSARHQGEPTGSSLAQGQRLGASLLGRLAVGRWSWRPCELGHLAKQLAEKIGLFRALWFDCLDDLCGFPKQGFRHVEPAFDIAQRLLCQRWQYVVKCLASWMPAATIAARCGPPCVADIAEAQRRRNGLGDHDSCQICTGAVPWYSFPSSHGLAERQLPNHAPDW